MRNFRVKRAQPAFKERRTYGRYIIIGASVSEPLLSDVYVNFVCHGPSGIATAHASHFLHMDRTAWQRRMRLIFMQVAVYVTMVTLFRQSIDNTYLESLARSEYL